MAQKSLGQGFLKLVTAEGHVLTNPYKPEDSLEDAGVQDSDHLTAVAQQAQVAALSFGFALWCCGGNRVVVWGNPRYADCSSVQDQNLQQIQATNDSFAAILADGSVVVWGDPSFGGDCSSVQDQLRNVQKIQATAWGAFCAILANGSVVRPSNYLLKLC
jgi:hypothetical protein